MSSLSQCRSLSATKLFFCSIIAVLLSGIASPAIMSWALNDGGFQRFGWNIDLAKWGDILAYRDDQPLMHTDLESEVNGRRYVSMWINTGQSLRFRNVPTTIHTRFLCDAMVNPHWSSEEVLPRVEFRVTIIDGSKSYIYKNGFGGAEKSPDGWGQIDVNLAPFAGDNVTIEISPVADRTGIWTLWRNPRIETFP
jgi:hypothetical protein